MAKILTQDEINNLTKLDENVKKASEGHVPAFSVQRTLSILNAVTEGKCITDDSEFTIRYYIYRDNTNRFYVEHKSGLPCGDFDLEGTIRRLSL